MKIKYLGYTISELPKRMHDCIIKDFKEYATSLNIYTSEELKTLFEDIERERLAQLTDYIDLGKYL